MRGSWYQRGSTSRRRSVSRSSVGRAAAAASASADQASDQLVVLVVAVERLDRAVQVEEPQVEAREEPDGVRPAQRPLGLVGHDGPQPLQGRLGAATAFGVGAERDHAHILPSGVAVRDVSAAAARRTGAAAGYDLRHGSFTKRVPAGRWGYGPSMTAHTPSQATPTGALSQIRPTRLPRNATTGELVTRLSAQISELVRGELALAKAELAQKGKRAGIGAGLAGTAGVLALYGVGALITTVIAALALVLPVWAAALIVAVVIFIVAGVLGLLGKNQIQRATPPVPENTVESVKRDVATVTERIKR